MKLFLQILFCFLGGALLYSQHNPSYFVQFIDKKYSSFSVDNPSAFLSQRAIDRRLKNNFSVTDEDLPVSVFYVDSITKMGARYMHCSRWFNGITIETSDTLLISDIRKLSFVKSIKQTANRRNLKSVGGKFKNESINELPVFTKDVNYGYALYQLQVENGQWLHEKGYRGAGILIAVLDAGFKNVDTIRHFQKLRKENRLISTSDFVKPGNNVFTEDDHGLNVLSILASDIKGTYIGAAPEASYMLMRTEDVNSEYPVEEDNWIAAIEMADSAGADVLNSSLGYTIYSDSEYNHSYLDMDGNTLNISKAAYMAAKRGLLVVVSAGNEGDTYWHFISAPADAKDILAVGALDYFNKRAYFSSFGPSADNRIKPDVACLGSNVCIPFENSEAEASGNGTSYSSPIMAGLAACLKQAFPDATVVDLISAIKQSSSQYNNPDNQLGYGIPDMQKAYCILLQRFANPNEDISVIPNPFRDYFVLRIKPNFNTTATIEFYTLAGIKVLTYTTPFSNPSIITSQLNTLQNGLYILVVKTNTKSWKTKVVKMN